MNDQNAPIRTWLPAVLVAALGYFVDVFDIWVFSAVRTKSLAELGVVGDQLISTGVLLINSQLIGMMLGGVLFGILGDRRGRLSVLLGSILLYSVATLACGFVQSVDQYVVLRFISGIGLAGEIGGGITLVAELVPKKVRGLATTFVAAVGVSGAVAAGLIGDALPWRVAFFVGGGAGLLLLFLRAGLLESKLFHATSERSDVVKGSVLLIFKNRTRTLRYLSCIAVGVPLWYIAGVLASFAPELGNALEVTGPVTVGKTLATATIGMAVMDVGSGVLSQLLKSRRVPLALFVGACGVLTTYLLTSQGLTPEEFYTAFFLIGCSLGYWAVLITTTAEQFGTNIRAITTTTVPNFIRGSGVPLTLCFELLRHSFGVVLTLEILGVIVLFTTMLGLYGIRETFNSDLDFIETVHGSEKGRREGPASGEPGSGAGVGSRPVSAKAA